MSTASSESEAVEGNCEILLLPCCNGGQYLLKSKGDRSNPMQAGVNRYQVNGYMVDESSHSPRIVDEDFNCLSKESNPSPQARLSVSGPRGVYKQLKLLAHDRDMTISALLVQLIKAEIQSLDA